MPTHSSSQGKGFSGRASIDTVGRAAGCAPDSPLPVRDSKSIRLEEATGQELALELLRRARSRSLNGDLVAQSLVEHRSLWHSVLFWCRPEHIVDESTGHREIIHGSYYSLSGLGQGKWMADHLWVIAVSREALEECATLASQWGAKEVRKHISPFHNPLPLGQPPAFALEAVFEREER